MTKPTPKQMEMDRLIRICQLEVYKAVQRGTLVPSPCESCGSAKKPHAHHDDYRKPLAVRWLCAGCHRRHHVLQRRLGRPSGYFRVGSQKSVKIRGEDLARLRRIAKENHWLLTETVTQAVKALDRLPARAK